MTMGRLYSRDPDRRVCTRMRGTEGRKGHSSVGTPTYDEEFLRRLVVYHVDQDRKFQPCATKQSIRKELRESCSQADQQHEEQIARMRDWLREWYGRDLQRGDKLPVWLGTLEGEQFERELFKGYLERHREVMGQTAKCSANATHTELRELCGRVNPAQKKTSEKLRKWLRECSDE